MSDGPFLCYRELVASSNVELSVFFRSYNDIVEISEEFLFTASSCAIEIYKIIRIDDDVRLSKCMHMKLFGKPQDITCIQSDETGKTDDLLFLALDTGKFVVFRYDSSVNSLIMLWMCNTEENASGYGANVQLPVLGKRNLLGAPAKVTSSSSDSLVCSILNGRHLLFVEVESFKNKSSNGKNTPIEPTAGNHFIVDVAASLDLDGPIIDCCFVSGYSKPVVAILQEQLLPVGHCAKNMNTCVLSVLAIDVISKNAAVLWTQGHLPHDSISIVPCSHNTLTSSVVVVSLNAVLLVSSQLVIGLAVNGFAGTSVAPHIDLQPWLGQDEGYELDGSRWLQDTSATASYTIVGTLKTGLLLRIGVAVPVGNGTTISGSVFIPEIVAKSVRCSTFSASRAFNLWFLGSRQAESLLLQVSPQDFDTFNDEEDETSDEVVRTTSLPPRKSMSVEDLVPLSPASKRQRRLTNSFMDEETYQFSNVPNDVASEEIFLYGSVITLEAVTSSKVDLTKASGTYLLTPADSIQSLGPVLDGSFCKPDPQFNHCDNIDWVNRGNVPNQNVKANQSSGSAASYIADREMKDCLQISTGLDEQAAICRVYSGLSLSKITVRNFVGATRVFSISDDKYRKSGYCTLLVGYETKTRVFHCIDSGSSDSPDLKLKEVVSGDSGFQTNDCLTVGVGLIHESNTAAGLVRTCVQICSRSLRLLKLGSRFGGDGNAIQDMLLSDSLELGGLGGEVDEYIVSGEVVLGWVSILTNKSNLFLLQHDVHNECLEVKHTKHAQLFNAVHLVESDETEASVKKEKNGHSSNGHAVNEIALGFDDLIRTSVSSATLYFGVLKFSIAKNVKKAAVIEQDESISSKTNDSIAAQKRTEEILLYGEALAEIHSDSVVSDAPMMIDIDEPNDDIEVSLMQHEAQAYVTLIEISGRLTILRLADLVVMFVNEQVIQSEDTLITGGQSAVKSSDNNKRFIIESKVARIGMKNDPKELSKLVLLLFYSTGDVTTYAGNESNGLICSFSKIDHRCINNKRNHKIKSDPSASVASEYLSYLTTPDHLNRLGDTFTFLSELNGSSGVLMSGNQPLILLGDHGLPTLLPIGLPEVPFINFGHHALVPLKVGGIKAIVSLWYEFEDLEALRNPSSVVINSSAPRHNKQSSLGIYQEVSELKVFSNSNVSVKKVNVGKTTHKCVEILKRTDDKTEQALLEKRTFVLSCSEEVKRPFIANVLTPEEMEKEDVLYERYLTSLESFSQPNLELGPAPNIIERSYQVSLMQGGAAVDSYTLPTAEKILDTAVLYLSFEKPATGVISFGMPIMTRESRIFIAVSTSIADRRGEDTLGSGRLLLFGLDFALFQENTHTEDGDAETKDSRDDRTGANDTSSSSSSMDVVSDSTSKLSSNGLSATSTQAKFLGSIQPKLKLLWSGPGPASVVKQMGEYVLSTVGSTLYVYRMNHTTLELEQVSFHFAQFYVTSISVVKNYIILADMLHSVQLLLWRPEDFSLTLISKDFDHSTVLSSACVHDGNKLGIIVSDDEGNIQIMQQNPKKLESNKGTKLLNLADFHVGSDVSVMLGHDLLTAELMKKLPPNPLDNRPPPPPPRTRKASSFPLQLFGCRLGKANSTKSAAIIGTMDGGLGMLIPLEERMYRRLSLLQQIMSITLQSSLALNPKEYRLLKTERFKFNKMKGVLDGSLLWTFNSLHPKLQDELAAAVGATAYTIKENLHDVEYLSSFI